MTDVTDPYGPDSDDTEEYETTVEEGTTFGLGSDNTQDAPPVPDPVEPDPLRHGLGQADEDNIS